MSLRGEPPAGAFVTEVRVRWSDMDAYGHVNHARLATLLEEARIDMLLALRYPLSELSDALVVVELAIRYHGQLQQVDSPITVHAWVSRVRAADFTVSYQVRPNGSGTAVSAAVTADSRHAMVDLSTGLPRRLTEAERKLMTVFSDAAGSAGQ